ncbi:MAG: amino acid permease, partial [Pseudomonadota bacterium]|nr:amino acid permease [Pseudomonadota bacterium]
MPIQPAESAPKPTLRIIDAIGIVVGIVVGAGIFKTPSLVAANSSSELLFIAVWVAGGLISLIGALCYAELATAYPNSGGDYHFLTRAFGHNVSFLFVWARMTVIQTGSIALLAFVFGDYAAQLYSFGAYSAPIYAALIIIILTGLNITGLPRGTRTQNILTTLEVLGLLLIVVVGLAWASPADTAAPAASAASYGSAMAPALGMAMVFVLLTYGGWNEAAYVSAEIKNPARNIVRTLIWSIGVVTALYVLVNLAFMNGLGLAAMAASEAVGADLMRAVLGERGAQWLSLLVAIAALTSINATTITGARTAYAVGRDYSLFRFMGHWNERAATPVNALLAQGAVALLLVALGTATREGFSTIVDYTAPVFWLFFLLTGISLFVLRRKEPGIARPFRVPLYPLTPLLFCATSLYMLASSLAYTGIGALVGVTVLLAGVPVLLLARRTNVVTTHQQRRNHHAEEEPVMGPAPVPLSEPGAFDLGPRGAGPEGRAV